MFYHRGTLSRDLMRGITGKIVTKIVRGRTCQREDLDFNLCLVRKLFKLFLSRKGRAIDNNRIKQI